ncbi:MAG TPA: NAD(P)-binding protein, partial [Myxococcota bacterium]|nr:NAD(P)-binding protein [Myxococcota bacterium]
MAKERFAVLGGGMGSLSAVFSLTSLPNWQDRYEITVYQHGWRLGGKGATGRRLDQHARIEEHGYHTLFGFYENTFALLRDCYKAYGRDPSLPLSQPIATSREEEAAHPGRYGLHREGRFVMLHRIPVGSWHTFSMHFPQTTDMPGDGMPMPSLWACIEAILQILSGCLGYRKGPTAKKVWRVVQQSGLANLLRRWHAGHPLRLLRGWYRLMGGKPGMSVMVPLMRRIVRKTWESLGPTVTTDWEAHSWWTTVDFMCTVLIGMCEDDVFRRGFDVIDHEEFYAWLTRHATVPEGMKYTLGSIWVQAAYDSSFAYRDGNTTAPPSKDKPMVGTPAMGAGTMIRGGWRLMLTYKGSMAWMFQAGTAEVIFSPMYEVLRRRGVHFEFFHRVEDLEVETDAKGAHISAIRMVQQATAKDPAGYKPLVEVAGVPCWPAEPLLDQLVGGE